MNDKEIISINKRHWDAIAVTNWPKKKVELPNIVKDPNSFLEKVVCLVLISRQICSEAGIQQILLERTLSGISFHGKVQPSQQYL